MPRTRRPRQNTSTASVSSGQTKTPSSYQSSLRNVGVSQIQGLPPFLVPGIIPILTAYAQQCIANFTSLTTLIAQCDAYLASTGQQTTSQPLNFTAADAAAAAAAIGADAVQTEQQPATGARAGAGGKEPTVDMLIENEMNSFTQGFTNQLMRDHLQQKYGAQRKDPIRMNLVSNALKRHWEAGRLWAVGGNVANKVTAEQWFPLTAKNRPANAYIGAAATQGQPNQAVNA